MVTRSTFGGWGLAGEAVEQATITASGASATAYDRIECIQRRL
jgi:hypothetical protein